MTGDDWSVIVRDLMATQPSNTDAVQVRYVALSMCQYVLMATQPFNTDAVQVGDLMVVTWRYLYVNMYR